MVSYDPFTSRQTLERDPLRTKPKSAAELAFETEKHQIISYEENWDSWDGPVWPLGTVQCSLQSPDCVLKECVEHHPPKTMRQLNEEQAFEQEKAQITSYEEGWDRWDGPIWPLDVPQCHLQELGCVCEPCSEHCSKKMAFDYEKRKMESAENGYEQGWDRWDGPVWPLGTVQCDLQRPGCVCGPCTEHCKTGRKGSDSEESVKSEK